MPGNGGHGIGAHDLQTVGSAGSRYVNGTYGGAGGNGANWGATGNTGNTGDGANSYQVETTNETVGYSGGLGGYYIVGNGNVTWEATGSRAGRVG